MQKLQVKGILAESTISEWARSRGTPISVISVEYDCPFEHGTILLGVRTPIFAYITDALYSVNVASVSYAGESRKINTL